MTTTFTINAENAIAAFPTPDHAEASIGAGAQAFSSEKEFGKITAEWPINRFVEIWNGFAGTPGFDKLKEVKKFENRAKTTARIWAAIQVLAPTAAAAAPPVAGVAPAEAQPTAKATRAKKPAKAPAAAKKAAPAAEPKTPRAGTKKEEVLRMLRRKNGATNAELQEAMGWQPHSVRGFISGGLRKTGVAVENIKRANGDTAYRIAE
jgi:nucleoid-associated protein YgaU